MAPHILDVQFPEVSPSGATSAGRMNISTSPAMFGGAGAQAEEALGQSIEKAGETGLDVMTARQHLTNEIHASEVNTDLADKITDRHTQFAQLQGRAALDGLPQYKKDLEQLYQDSMESTGSLQEKAMLAKTGRQLTTRYYGYGTQHADGQWRKWADETATRRAATFGQQAVIASTNGDDTGMQTFLNTSDDEVRKLSEQKGFDSEATDAAILSNRGRNLKQIIESRIDESPVAASALYRQYEHQMDAASSLAVRTKLRGALSQIQGRDLADEETGRSTPKGAEPIAGVQPSFLGAIKRSEGYRPNAYWDVKQHSIGYGTRASGPDETITREEADRRFGVEIEKAAQIVDKVNPNLDPGSKAALTSLTYNAGADWTRGGLGDKVRAGDMEGARQSFLQYNKAGGVTNGTLVARRYEEAGWFGQSQAPAGGLPDKAEAFERIVARTRDNPLIQNAALARMNQIYAVYRQEAVSNTAAFKGRLKDSLAEASATGNVKTPIGEEEFVAHLGGEAGLAAKRDYDQEVQFAGDVHSMASMGPEEIDALRSRYAPKPGQEDYAEADRRAQAIDKAASQLSTERQKDPAAYAVKYLPAVRDAADKMTAAISDPAVPLAQKQAAARDFATRQLLEQERIGVPPDAQRIVTKDYVDGVSKALSGAADSDDPQKRVTLIGQIKREAATWGEYWPAVMRQMADKTEPLVRAIAAGADEGAMTRLLSLPKDATPKSIVGEQNETKLADVTKNVNDAMAPFRQTLVGRQLDRDFPGYQGLGLKLAALHARDGDDASTAATKAFNELIGNRYDFRDTYRIPKSAAVSADDVQAGVVAAQLAIRQQATEAGGNALRIQPAIDDMGLRETNRADSFVKFARDGRWVTSPDNGGLNLVYGDKFVRTEGGAPLFMSWADLAKRGTTPEARATAQQHLTQSGGAGPLP